MIPPVVTHPEVVPSELELLCSSIKGGSQIGWALEELRDQYHNSLSPSSSALSALPPQQFLTASSPPLAVREGSRAGWEQSSAASF